MSLTAKSSYGDDGTCLPLSDTSGCIPCSFRRLPLLKAGKADEAQPWMDRDHHQFPKKRERNTEQQVSINISIKIHPVKTGFFHCPLLAILPTLHSTDFICFGEQWKWWNVPKKNIHTKANKHTSLLSKQKRG